MEHDLETGSSPSPAPAVAAIKPELVIACTFVSAVVFIGAFIAFYPQDTLLPTFSVDVAAGFDGLDGGGPAANATTMFDLTLHGVTRRRLFRTLGICNERARWRSPTRARRSPGPGCPGSACPHRGRST
ncbi:hypothetical protein C2845_PM16G14050 [Panicum miliaceum]|uniref:Uncharacterized protein n=1 Tax=Panicum miliaceum TaxID=4540 RepID=A0A3L6PT11_PANMI|nr:hypothetical protein C2845_PM16G14050 [Panicum miliaceum]